MIIRIAELPIIGDWNSCIERAVSALKMAPLPDIMLLPELFTVGFELDKIAEQAVTIEDLKHLHLAQAAAETRVSLVAGTFPVKTSRGIVNMLPVYSRNGELTYTTEKAHLFKNMGEDKVFEPGTPSGVFSVNGVISGASICYDLRFPELFRNHTLGGARIIFLPAQWPESRIDLFRSYLQARAGEAQVFFVGCNLGGDHLGERFRGGGGVASPGGVMMVWNEVNEYVRDYEIDINEVDRVRERISCLKDRRPEIYGV